MSILKKIGDNPKGGIIYCAVLTWIGIIVGIPSIIWSESSVGLCGIVAICVTFYLTVLDQFDIPFVKDYPLTFLHLCYIIVYSIALAISVIVGSDAELFASAMFGIGALLISFIVDIIFQEKDQKEITHAQKCRKVFKVGDKFGIKYHAGGSPYIVHYTIVAIEEDKVAYRDHSYITNWEDIELFKKKVQDKNFNWEE